MNAARPRWVKVLADLWGNRTRSLLVVASITVGLFAIGVIATIYVVIAQDMRASYAAVNPANVYIQTNLFEDDLLKTVEGVEGVSGVQGVRAFSLRFTDYKGDWKNIELKAYSDLDALTMNQPILVQGAWPPKDGQIVVSRHKYTDLRVPIGGVVKIERPSGKVRELVLVGIVQDLTIGAFSGGGGFFGAGLQGYITRDTLDLLEQPSPDLLSGVYLTASKGNDLQSVQAAATLSVDALEAGGADVTSSTPRLTSDHPNSYLVNAVLGVLLVLGLLVTFLSGFLITNTLQALLNQQMQQIGIMKTVGARRLQIAGVYVILILVFSALALALAVPLAFSVSFTLLNVMAAEINFIMQGQRLVWQVILLQVGLALVMPQLAAWLPISHGTSISVQEALSGIGKVDGKAKHNPAASEGTGSEAHQPLRRKGLRRPRFLTRPLLISLRNTFRRKGRLALTLTTLTLGGAVFIATFNVQVSLQKYIDQIGQYFLSDVSVTLDRPYRTAEIEELLKDVPGVGSVEGWAAAQAEIVQADGSAGESVSLLAPPVGSTLIQPVLMEGRWIEPGDESAIALNEIFHTRFPDLKIGDPIELMINGKSTTWTVVGFFRFAGMNGGYTAYASYDYLTGLTYTTYKAATFQINAESAGLSAREQDELSKEISAQLDAAGIKVASLNTGAYLTDVAGSAFTVLIAFLLFLAVLTALVGSIGLAGTMSMNVMERTREIGVLRAIGASDRILMRMVLVEGFIIGAISYLAGALLSFPVSKLMADGISRAVFDAPSSFGFSWIGFVIWLAVVALLSLLASAVPAKNAARLTIREVLAYE